LQVATLIASTESAKPSLIGWALFLCGGFGDESVNGTQERLLVTARQALDLLKAAQHTTVG